jgi:hypothetical protein
MVNEGIRMRINRFIYSYNTLNEIDIINNLPDVTVSDVREVLDCDFSTEVKK